jgi:predicted phage terminase large subunit-like protein
VNTLAQYSFVAFDEATDFTETQIGFLTSRMRNTNVNYSPQMFLCTNPSYHSFLREWIEDFYLDPLDGTPLKEKQNVERYFVRQGNDMKWFNTRAEAEAIHGTGMHNGVRSFRFVSARIYDNPYLMGTDYLSNLMALPRVQKLIMLEGSWTAREETSGYWHRNHVHLVKQPPDKVRQRVLAVDFAFTAVSESNKSPDSTAFVLMSKDHQSNYTVEYVYTMQDRVHMVEDKLFELASQFGQETIISIPQDPNAQAGAYAKGLQKRLSEKGFICRLQKPVKSKLVRFQPFAAVTEGGFVNVVEGGWNKSYFDQLEIFDGNGKYHDDMVDATSDAFFLLNQSRALPSFQLPDLTQSTQFGFQSSQIPSDLVTPL